MKYGWQHTSTAKNPFKNCSPYVHVTCGGKTFLIRTWKRLYVSFGVNWASNLNFTSEDEQSKWRTTNANAIFAFFRNEAIVFFFCFIGHKIVTCDKMQQFNLFFVDNAYFRWSFICNRITFVVVCHLKQSNCFRFAQKLFAVAQFYRNIHALFKAYMPQIIIKLYTILEWFILNLFGNAIKIHHLNGGALDFRWTHSKNVCFIEWLGKSRDYNW